MNIIPLTNKQWATINCNVLDTEAKPFRLLANGHAVTLATGYCSPKGSNIMHHPVYFDRPKKYVKQVLEYMQANNPQVKFRITYH